MSVWKKNKPDATIAEGLILRSEAEFDTEPRFLTLLMKGFIVYLVVMGSMGCLLSSFKIPYNAAVIHIAVFVGALFSAFLYLTKVWENLGYFILFAFMLGTGLLLRRYISSGFFAVVNIISERAAYYFDTEVVQGYAESIGNRAVTVTIAMVYVGWVHAILLNALISRQMKYFAVMFTSFFFLTVPFYLECEPDMLYVLMLLAGCVIVFVFRGARHTPIKTNNQRFEYLPKKRHINYVYAVRHHMTMVLIMCAVVAVFGGIFLLFVDKRDYESSAKRGRSAWKVSTEDAVENVYKNGIWGFFNRYDTAGGLKSGLLGGVNSVTLDYETDLEVTYVPYSAERMYLRSFTGDQYLPVDNRWQRATSIRIDKEDDGQGNITLRASEQPMDEETTSDTAKQLKKRFEEGKRPSAKARMDVRNIAAPMGAYLPYYVDEEGNTSILRMLYRNDYRLTYYPWLTGQEPVGEGKDDSDKLRIDGDKKIAEMVAEELRKNLSPNASAYYSGDQYTHVPDENTAVIDEFIRKAGLEAYKNDPDALVKALADYYQQEIPYTYQPGMTPRGKDFINYFLADNRRGYCAHFASAATLILRRLGYRARYVEGYAIDPTDLGEDARIRSELSVSDYYEGDALLEKDQLRVVTVQVTDAMAHAWVELERDGHWQICDITPWSEEEAPSGGFLQGLIDFLSGTTVGSSASSEDITGGEAGGAGLDQIGHVLGYGFLILTGAAVFFLLILALYRLCRGRIRYLRAGRNDRLVMDFHRASRRTDRRLMQQAERAAETDGEGSETPIEPAASSVTINYRERVEAMRRAGQVTLTDEERDELVRILEKAGFSGGEIREDEDAWAREHF